MKKLLIIFLFSIPFISNSQVTFTEISTSILGVSNSSIDFSDIDSDGDQDLLITGTGGSSWGNTVLYKNDGSGNFTEVLGTPFDGITHGSVAFEDIDNDGDEDLLITGDSMGQGEEIAKLYINDGLGTFTQTAEQFIGVSDGCVVFVDVDNDGDKDVLISGFNWYERTDLYLNDGNGNFTEFLGTGLIDVIYPSIAFSDIDGDGDKDVLITGDDNSGSPFSHVTKLYTNNGLGIFTEINHPFEDVGESSIAFSDIDNDGDNDVLITGHNNGGGGSFVSILYINDGSGIFTPAQVMPFVQVYESSVAFSDVNGDGYADVLITGEDTTANDVSKLYINDALGGFNDLLQNPNPFFGVYDGDVAFADIDNDGDNDVLITGAGNGNYNAKLYLNNFNSTAITEISIVKCEAFPNPSRDVFNVKFTSLVRQDLEVRIINSIGEIVYIDNINNHIGEYSNSINLENHSKGVYLLELDTDNGMINKKLILQ